ncbi:hypothetical protein VSR69_42260 [Paraburkholderia phytofirmans]
MQANAIGIRIHNTDIGDLYVSIWDRNTADNRLLIDGDRINEEKELNLPVTADGDNHGKIAWRAVRVDDPNAVREDEQSVSSGDRVDVTTRFA